jgi:hypothetical protein
MKRIFVSSVMRDFADRRSAAKTAISTLDHLPVMAEDFGARPYSAQSACLEGVRSSDIYVGVFGRRYGDAAASGLSPTEEEFNEARHRGMTMLCFVESCEKEAEQESFLKRLKKYEDGLTIDRFDSPAELERKVIKALHRAIGQSGVSDLDDSTAADIFARHNWGAADVSGQRHFDGPSLGVVIVPTRYGQEYFPWRQLATTDFQNQFLQAALFGSRRLFDARHANEFEDDDDHIELRQIDGSRQRIFSMLRVSVDGVLTFTTDLADRERKQWNDASLRSMIIDQGKVEHRVVDFASFADGIYSRLPQNDLLSSFFFGVSLSGISGKHFGHLGSDSPRSLSGTSTGIDDPLKVPPAPMLLSRAQLKDGAALAMDLCDQVARRFRKRGALYEPSV